MDCGGRACRAWLEAGVGVLVILFVLAGAPTHALAQAVVAGIVVDGESGDPIAAAAVALVGEGRQAVTSADGRFRFGDVEVRRHRLHVVAFGYLEADTTIAGLPGVPADIRVGLRRAPVRLEDIVVAPGRFGILEAHPTVSGTTLRRADIEAIPQFGDDVLWTLRRVPGVATDDFSAKLNVRGGAPRDIEARLDGLELFEPYHLQDVDGLLGVVDVQSLGSMELVTGGFPADFGGRMGGILDMRTREPPGQGSRNAVGMSLSSLSFHSRGSFADQRGQWLATARRGFLDIMLDITNTDDRLRPRYWDALARIQYLLTPDHLVSVEVLHAGDDSRWSDPQDSGARLSSTWSSGYAWATWQAQVTRDVHAETVVSVGRLTRDRTGRVSKSDDGVFTPLLGHVRDLASFDFAGIRQDWQLRASPDLMVKAGYEARSGRAAYDYANDATWATLDDDGRIVTRTDSTDVDVSPSGSEVGAWLSIRARTGPALTWDLGVRYDGMTHTHDRDVSPRLLARWDPDSRTSVKASWGRYAQGQRLYELDVVDGETRYSPAERAHQVAVGIERRFGRGVHGRIEAYARMVEDAQPWFGNIAREVNPLLELDSDRLRVDPSRSRAHGVEVYLAQELGSLSWSAAWVLSRAEDEIERVWVPRTLDQTHTLNLMAVCRWGGAWQLSGSWQYHTGWPATNQVVDVVTREGVDEQQMYMIAQRGFDSLNGDRLPPYHRLDLRVMRAFQIGHGRLEVFADVFNVYDRANLRGFVWNLVPAGAGWRSIRDDGETLLPRMPTVGFRWTF